MSTRVPPSWATAFADTKGSEASTSSPKARDLAHTILPILPKPTIPKFLPLSRIIRMVSGTLPHPVVFTELFSRATRRFHVSNRAITWSDTSSTQ